LEKIEMKKTLVAVAAMAAVTGAMAQATIYGTIDQAYTTNKTTSSAGVTTKTTGLGGPWNGGSAIGFKGSEDLGGGLKASFQYEMGVLVDQPGGPDSYVSGAASPGYENRNSFLGLSGGFGGITMGRQYNLAFYNVIGADPMGFSGAGAYLPALAGGAGRADNLIIYTLPSVMPGLNIQLSKGMGEKGTTPTSPTKAGDSTEYGISYSAGALFAGYVSNSVKGGTYANPFSGSTVTTTAPTAYAGTAGDTIKGTSTTLTYDLGMAKLLYGGTKTTQPYQTTTKKANAYSIVVPINALSVSYTSATYSTTASAVETKLKGTQIRAAYALSKRTTAYFDNGKYSTNGTTSSVSNNAFGLLHAF